MRLFWWRFLTLLLTSLSLGLSICHLFEMPVRMRWPAVLWADVTTFHGLYYVFGRIGAGIDIGAVGAAIVLAVLTRKRHPAFGFSLAAALLFAAGLGLWIVLVSPMNAVMATWRPGVTADVIEPVRRGWEFGHAAVAIAKLAGLAALFLAVLADTAAHGSTEQPGR
jgi:hypothetical protein